MSAREGARAQTRLTVNGCAHESGADPDTPLLYVLRNELGLTGARFGCGLGLCGACFVHVDGAVVASCDTPLWSVEGRTVVTVEGLSVDGPNPVQRALIDHQACLLYTSPSPRDYAASRMPSSA